MAKALGSEAPPEQQPGPKSRAWLLLGALLLVVAFLIVVPNFIRARSSGQLTACKSNLKNLGTALHMYAADNQGQYPDQLQHIVTHHYLRTLPTCPTAMCMSYTDYHVNPRHTSFSVGCCGNAHPRNGANHPRFDSQRGLLEHP